MILKNYSEVNCNDIQVIVESTVFMEQSESQEADYFWS